MRPWRIIPIVEGPGDQKAVPELVRRVLYEVLQPGLPVEVARPKCAQGYGPLDSTAPGEGVEKYFRHAVNDGADAVLIVVDADRADPTRRARGLANRLRALGQPTPAAVVCAHRGLESWLVLGHQDHMAGQLPSCPAAGSRLDWYHLDPVPRAVRLIERELLDGAKYSKSTDPPRLVARLDIALLVRQSRSFRRLVHAVEELVAACQADAPAVTPL